ncbi:MAG: stalk domain-containing protein, partial [Limnochordales bacterium]
MERGCRFFLFFLFSLVIVLTSAPAVDASIELRIDGETVPARSALALLGTGLGIASDVLRAELGVLVDDADFPVVALHYGTRHAVLVVDDGRAVLDGRRVDLQVPPRVVDGVLFIPLNLVADIVDLRMNWDIASGTLALDHRQPQRAAAIRAEKQAQATVPGADVGGAPGTGAALAAAG